MDWNSLKVFFFHFSDDEVTEIKKGAIEEFKRHMKEINRDETNEDDIGSIVDVIDSIVDAIYYMLDTLVRCKFPISSHLNVLDKYSRDGLNNRTVIQLMQKWYEMVEEFTISALGPEVVEKTDRRKQVKFVSSMVLSEILEGAFTHDDDPLGTASLFLEGIQGDMETEDVEKILEGIILLIYNATLYGICNFRELFIQAFLSIHTANLNKGIIDSEGNRKFITKEISGGKKIIKPEGWKPANLYSDLAKKLMESENF